jgi:hypothetical protein
MSAARFAWKQYRFEIVSMLALLALAACAMQFVTFRMNGLLPAECVAHWNDIEFPDDPCVAPVKQWLAQRPLDMHQVLGFVPLIVGVVLGSALVSREIEHRTAQLGWSLSSARRRWLLERVVPIGVVMLGGFVLLAVVSDLHESAIQPGIDPRASFDNYGARGLPLVMRGVVVFTGSLLAGALVGRQLPALILGGALAVAIGYGTHALFPYGEPTAWVDDSLGMSGVEEVTDVRSGDGWLSPDGRVLTYQQASALSPYSDDSATFDWLNQRFTYVSERLVGDQLTEVELRETIGLAGLAIVALAGSIVVVRLRKPY